MNLLDLTAPTKLEDPPHEIVSGAVLVCLVGSRAHGCTDETGGDLDMLGVFVESKRRVMGLTRLDHYDAQTEAGQNTANDVDLKLYSLRNFVKLVAHRGNPSATELLFAPTLLETPVGRVLRDHAPMILHKGMGRQYLGYMSAQRERMMGLRGQMNVKRPKLVERHGFDVKYAYQMLRLGMQGIELMQTGRVSMPMSEQDRKLLIDVRTGKLPFEDVLILARDIEARLERATIEAPLPDLLADSRPAKPEHVRMFAEYMARVDQLLVDLHEQHWAGM